MARSNQSIIVIPTEAEARAAAEWRDLKAGYQAAWLNMPLPGPSTPFRYRSTPLGMT